MHKRTLGLLVLAALLLCCLIAGTPVNNDPSPSAEIAGIHLSPQPSVARAAVADVAPFVAAIMTALFVVAAARIALDLAPRSRPDASCSALLWRRSCLRRGPPLAPLT